MTRCLNGRGTRSQVCIPSRDTNSSLEALIQWSLLGDFISWFQVQGVSTSLAATPDFAQFPRRSGGQRERPEQRRGGAVEGRSSGTGAGTGSGVADTGGGEGKGNFSGGEFGGIGSPVGAFRRGTTGSLAGIRVERSGAEDSD